MERFPFSGSVATFGLGALLLVGLVTAGPLAAQDDDCDPFIYTLEDTTAFYNADDGETTFCVNLSIVEDEDCPASDDYPAATQGFQCGVIHDDTLLSVVEGVERGALADMRDDAGPAFFGVNTNPINGPGFTLGVVYSLTGGVFLEFDEELDVVEICYETIADEFIDVEDSTTTDLEFVDDLGSPILPNSVVVEGVSMGVVKNDATVTLEAVVALEFIRGDCNVDGAVNIGDGIWILAQLFQSGPSGTCFEACDVNGDTAYDQSDAVFLLNYRFLEGPEPPDPFPTCGFSSEELPDCVENDACN